ncbi:hypothetical protein ACJZ2D_007658 [Fusarium nematophilum]
METAQGKAAGEPLGQAQDTKKQRKRDTDRLAQREHRRRQKQHIQDLEAEVSLLKQQPSHSQVVQLVEENKLLKEELAALRGVLGSVRSLLDTLPPSSSRLGASAPHRTSGVPPFAARERSTSDDALSCLELTSRPLALALPSTSAAFDPFIASPYTEYDTFLADQDGPLSTSPDTLFTIQPSLVVRQSHLSLPSHCPSSPEDQRIVALIQKVKCGELRHAADPPCLMEYMLDGSHDSLAGCLKDYLEPFSRARKSSELLATYWVVYTLVIWQAYQTPECFERLPPWLRPTQFQIAIPHPMCIDFIPWPLLRDRLIRMYSSNWSEACSVLAALSEYMEFTADGLLGDDLSASSSLHSVFGAIDNWKLGEGFFYKYRQFQGSCEC